MKRIDRDTVQKILDTADIVEVVSDFVNLKKRGANYIGLCPFHNERTPSFSVSKSKGICKCFSCGKGGSPVNFIMELEQMSFNEALRYLAKKYNIEIAEHEMSEQEREEQSTRESMLAINDYAMRYFERTLADTDDGRNIGLAYFHERGINEAMIQRFHLGYSLEKRDAFYTTATEAGYSEKFMIDTGLVYKTDKGMVNDRFRGRVIYPVFTVSGKVVAFGGRTLRTDKEVAKYVNSPESIIYSKSRELYGLYQAKQAIVKKDKCILVEGYMDVISMHQSGIENVVASSGTSLTEGQIRLIHRFTENVTVIYDSDAAGIKASLRGIDLLLAEGMNVKVLLLPEGDDPDSFAQSHSSSEVEEYIAAHEEDFISFKTKILLEGLERDPISRAKAIQNIVRSISVIPDAITRTVYIGECSRVMGISEQVLTQQVKKDTANYLESKATEEMRRRNRINAGLEPDDQGNVAPIEHQADPQPADTIATDRQLAKLMFPYEKELLQYALKYGMRHLCDMQIGEDSEMQPMTVLQYIRHELETDSITLANESLDLTLATLYDLSQSPQVLQQIDDETARLHEQYDQNIRLGREQILNSSDDLTTIQRREEELITAEQERMEQAIDAMKDAIVQRHMLSHENDTIRRISTDLVSSRHTLSKIHTKFSHVVMEHERIGELVPLATFNLKSALIEWDLKQITQEIAQAYTNGDNDTVATLLTRASQLNDIKKELSKYLGERILTPKR